MIDITKPFFIVIPALVSILCCYFLFFPIDFFVIFNGFFSLVLFSIISTLMTGLSSIGKSLPAINYNASTVNSKYFYFLFKIIVLLSFSASIMLVLDFSDKFGFYSVFTKSYLLQNHGISNSLGNFLYINVIIFPISLYLSFVVRRPYIFIAVISLFFLYFTGIKSYLFQSLILLFYMIMHSRTFSKSVIYIFFLFSILLMYFFIYDYYIDNSSDNIISTINRFLAYFSGSWGTFNYYLLDGWDTPYPGLTIFYPLYKLFSFGSIRLADYNRFYDVSGYQLNVVPFFQLAYLEGGIIFQSIVIFATSFLYSFFRYFAVLYPSNVFFRVLFYFFCGTFIISSLFANVFSDLPVYIVISILMFFGFMVNRRPMKRLF